MSKRGLSAAEKRVKMLELLHEEKQFFQLKELERLAPAKKGIVSQSVKDVLQELMDDGHVDYDKIGTSNFFWSFQSAVINVQTNILQRKQAECSALQTKIKLFSQEIKSALLGREQCTERTALVERYRELRDQSAVYREKASAYGQADPQVYNDKVSAGEIARREAGRHTENVLILFDWMRRTFECKEDALRSMFELESDWEQGYS